jgi:hypothetical protein
MERNKIFLFDSNTGGLLHELCSLAEDMLMQINNVHLDSDYKAKLVKIMQSLNWNAKSEN